MYIHYKSIDRSLTHRPTRPNTHNKSNALAALAGLLGPHGGRFPRTRLLYFCKPLPAWLRNRPVGTYARALNLGVEVRTYVCFGWVDGSTDF